MLKMTETISDDGFSTRRLVVCQSLVGLPDFLYLLHPERNGAINVSLSVVDHYTLAWLDPQLPCNIGESFWVRFDQTNLGAHESLFEKILHFLQSHFLQNSQHLFLF